MRRTNHIQPLLGYLLITLAVTWPLALNFTTHIPGGGDAPWFLWQFWWFKYAPLDLQQLPYQTSQIFYPLTDVPVMAQTPINETLMLPLLVGTNLVLFYNLLFLLSYLLSGYFTYLLGRALGCRASIAFVGGVIFAFCAYRGMRGLGHMSLLTTQWMPLLLLLGLQCWRVPTLQRGLALGTITALVALSSPYYIGLFLLPVALTAALYLPLTKGRALWRPRLWRALLAGAGIAALLTVPLYLHYLFLDRDIYALTATLTIEISRNGADLLSWLLPSGLHPWWGQHTTPIYQRFSSPNLMETTLFVGYLPLLLFFYSLVQRRLPATGRFWQLLTIIALLLALGPTLQIQGNVIVDGLPYHWLLQLPGFGTFRIPSRTGITTALALSVIAMLMLQQLFTRSHFLQRQRWLLAGWALLYLLTVFPFFPHPLTDMTIPTVYQQLPERSEPYALLELPAGEYFQHEYNFFQPVAQWMRYQSSHGHPTISGYLGRRPARLHEPERTLPFVRRFFTDDRRQSTAVDLSDIALLPEPYWPPDIFHAPALLSQADIGAVLLHCTVPEAQRFCLAAAPILSQALGMPTATAPATEATHRLHPVIESGYQTQRLPQYFTEVVLDHDRTFIPVDFSPAHRSRELDLADSSDRGTIRFTVPYTGSWRVQGILSGALAPTSQVQLNGATLPLHADLYAGYGVTWSTERTLAAGTHEITIQPLGSVGVESNTTAACAQLCVHNVSVRLRQILPPEETPTTAFTAANGETLTLLQQRLLRPSSPSPSAPPRPRPGWFMTVWQLDPLLATRLTTAPHTMPNIFLHFKDEVGRVVAQADHPLGERHLFDREQRLLYDFAPLPTDAANAVDLMPLEVEFGVWYPADATYFRQPAVSTTQAHFFAAGQLATATTAFTLPTFPTKPTQSVRFVAASHDGAESATSLTLLNARLVSPDQQTRVTPEQPQSWELLTTWAVPHSFQPTDELLVLLYLANDEAADPLLAYQLGGHDLLRDGGGYLVERVALPPLADLHAAAPNYTPSELPLSLTVWDGSANAPLPMIPLTTAAAPRVLVTTPPRLLLGHWQTLTTLDNQGRAK